MAKNLGRFGINPLVFQNHIMTHHQHQTRNIGVPVVATIKLYSTDKKTYSTNIKGIRKRVEHQPMYYPDIPSTLKNDLLKPKFEMDERFELSHQILKEETPLHEIEEVYYPPKNIRQSSQIQSLDQYHNLYQKSVENPSKFWKDIAEELHFEKWSENGLEYNFDPRKGEVFVKFMEGAKTNMAYNCLERNIEKGLGDKVAYLWEGNEPGDTMSITYKELQEKVVQFSKVLRSKGVKKGDVVAIYLPMTIELPIAMLACARIGALHSVVFAGFSADSLANRICQAKAKVLLTADGFYRGNKAIPLKQISNQALEICEKSDHSVESVIMLEHLQRVKSPRGSTLPEVKINEKIDSFWEEEVRKVGKSDVKEGVEWNDSEDPLFILYTSGSTGTPKGLVHTTTGYMTYAYHSVRTIFDTKPEDVFWCTADIGWITGHTFVVYGPLLNGLTTMIFEGVPNYPDGSRVWDIVEKYKVSKLYTAPTAVRSLMACPDEMVTNHNRDSLKIIGVAGEPINPGAWRWLHKTVGQEKCSIVDTYWQTETGGPMLTPFPGATPTKPGSATMPFFGNKPVLVDDQGNVLDGSTEGNLCFAKAWPSMARTIWKDHDRFVKTYFSQHPGLYCTGDGARRDHDNYYWVTGRVDDKMNVAGHLLSTSEIESIIVLHEDVVESAVVAAAHPSKGQVPYAFVCLKNGKTLTPSLSNEIQKIVREKIGPFAMPYVIHEASGLPKTRSGKITRRILRIIAEGDHKASLGDTSTLLDESVIGQLWKSRPNVKFVHTC